MLDVVTTGVHSYDMTTQTAPAPLRVTTALVVGWESAEGHANGETVNTWREATALMRRVVTSGGTVTELREVTR